MLKRRGYLQEIGFSDRLPDPFRIGILVLLILGILLHGYRLGYKLYWHDEVYTTMRSAGYTLQDVDAGLFSDRTFTPDEVLQFQRIKPGSTAMDTLNSLATEDPQHPPLYFLMNRVWMQIFGPSILANRSLAVLFSLLTLPAMYFLAMELFASPLAAWCSTLLLAFSPFDILFAQIARQYSLFTLFILLSSWLLLRALRPIARPGLQWGLYVLTCVGGLYTQPFFGLTLMSHGAYVLARQWGVAPGRFVMGSFSKQQRSPFVSFLKAMGMTLLLYAPWIGVIVRNFDRILLTTNWSEIFPGYVVLLKFWVLSFTALFFDLDFGFNNPLTFLLRIPYLIIIGASCWVLVRRTRPETWGFVLISMLLPFLLFAVTDLLLQTQRTTASRYLIPCFPFVQLAVGYWIATSWADLRPMAPKRAAHPLWLVGVSLLLSGSLASILISAHSETWWNRVPSYFNAAIYHTLNQADNPLLIGDPDSDGPNLINLISLAHGLDNDVSMLLLKPASELDLRTVIQDQAVFLYNPSEPVQEKFEELGLEVDYVDVATLGVDLRQGTRS